MYVPISVDLLPLNIQKEIYLELKEKFENFPFADLPLPIGDALLNMELCDFRDVSTRMFYLFEKAKLRTVSDLTKISRKDLEAISGFGSRSLKWVEEFLSEKGLTLKG